MSSLTDTMANAVRLIDEIRVLTAELRDLNDGLVAGRTHRAVVIATLARQQVVLQQLQAKQVQLTALFPSGV